MAQANSSPPDLVDPDLDAVLNPPVFNEATVMTASADRRFPHVRSVTDVDALFVRPAPSADLDAKLQALLGV